jgi:hypothetical protein
MTSLSVTFWSGIESRSAGCVGEERRGEKELHSKLKKTGLRKSLTLRMRKSSAKPTGEL